MKNLNSKNTNHLFFLLLLSLFIFSSCERDELTSIETESDYIEQSDTKNLEHETQTSSQCYSTNRGSCDDNLTNNGCNFTTGQGRKGRDMPNQYLMVNMLDNCRTEQLPANCSWVGNHTQTRVIEVDLNNCCSPAYALNSRLDNWRDLAIANKPDSSYLITDYERIYGFMVTSYGPYRMRIRVTYRKKICSIGTVDVIRK
ncbi:hypothetical protein [Aquimarina sp. MMG016]|uniref:hypothetical protein n=1 Tax=Aquimarina sp. MMG016 TaxID=2822690 RepID=UPI001B39FB15|nr:hypothetical protein [Aquimarina sp. MMG016]MBQ4821899.1 hypothetical protein [Aquimarina sp. MMG016]